MDMTDEEFYGKRLEEHFYGKSSSYLRNLKKIYHKFKLVEIVSNKEIKTHFNFNFPRLLDME